MNRIISLHIVDTDSGEILVHSVRDVLLDNKNHVESLHRTFDLFLKELRKNPMLSFEIIGYREHKQFELPF